MAAVVVAESAVSLDDLREHCKAIGIDKAKWPDYLTFVDKIPLSAIGKVQRGVLEDYVWEQIKQIKLDGTA